MRVAWIVVVAGCWRSTPTPVQPSELPQPAVATRGRPRGPSHCERAIDHVVGVMQPEIDRNQSLKDRQHMLRDAAVEGCVATNWSTEVLGCYEEAIDVASLAPCREKLTDDQRTDLNQRITDTMKQPVP